MPLERGPEGKEGQGLLGCPPARDFIFWDGNLTCSHIDCEICITRDLPPSSLAGGRSLSGSQQAEVGYGRCSSALLPALQCDLHPAASEAPPCVCHKCPSKSSGQVLELVTQTGLCEPRDRRRVLLPQA